MGNHPQESLENIINTTGTLLGVLPIVPWVFGSKNKPPDVADRGHTRQNERLRCQHLLAAPDTHDTLHLLGAIDAIEDNGWGVSGGHVFFRVRRKHLMWLICRNHGTVGKAVRCKDWGWTSETVSQPSPQGSTQRDNNRGLYTYIYIYSHYKDSLLTVGWPSPM